MSEAKKIRIALLFGGKSAEHEVSVISARNIYNALDKNKYEVTLIGITKEGNWLSLPSNSLEQAPERIAQLITEHQDAVISLVPEKKQFLMVKSSTGAPQAFDVVFPILHGPFGEDGSVQGLCKLLDVPFVGPGIVGSAVGMDKDVMKRLLREAGLPVANAVVLMKHQSQPLFSEIQSTLGTVVFVKPANLGSSVGVSRVTTEEEYQKALEQAFLYDTKILIEEAIVGREIECAVLGNENPKASVVGEIVTNPTDHSFYSYEAKYLDENGSAMVIPADLSSEKMAEIQTLAVKVFQTLCCEGMGRVDFFLKSDGSWVVNEINTIPGFTAMSMYPKMWEASGILYSDLIDSLINLALERFERDRALKTTF